MQNYYQAADEMIAIFWMNSAVYLNTSINSGRINYIWWYRGEAS